MADVLQSLWENTAFGFLLYRLFFTSCYCTIVFANSIALCFSVKNFAESYTSRPQIIYNYLMNALNKHC